MIRHALRALAVAPFALASLLAGCAAQTGTDGQTEEVATSQAAIKTTKVVTVATPTLKTLLALFDFGDVHLSAANGTATLVPSAGLALALAPNDANRVADQTKSFSVGPYNLGSYSAVAYVVGGQIDPGLTVTLGSSTIGVDTVVEGQLSVVDSIKNFSVDVAATIHVDIGIANDRPYVAGASTNITQKSAVDCGFLGWCDPIVQLVLNDTTIAPKVDAQMISELNTLFQSSTGVAAWNAFLLSRANSGNAATDPAWALVPGTVSLSNSALSFTVIRDAKPVAPSCSAVATTCDGKVTISCAGSDSNALEVAVQGANGVWSSLSTSNYPTVYVAPFSLGGSVNMETCEANTWGAACSVQPVYVKTCSIGPILPNCNLATHANCPVTPPGGGQSE